MARRRPHIEIGNIEKKRDKESFRTFLLDVIKDTFIKEFTPTSISLNGELFTLTVVQPRLIVCEHVSNQQLAWPEYIVIDRAHRQWARYRPPKGD